MVDNTPFLPGLSPVAGKAVVARFDGGRLSSEGGLLALREVERRLGLARRLAGCLTGSSQNLPGIALYAKTKGVHRVARTFVFERF